MKLKETGPEEAVPMFSTFWTQTADLTLSIFCLVQITDLMGRNTNSEREVEFTERLKRLESAQ